MEMKSKYDVLVIGAGGAGMMCAAQAATRGRRTLIVDHSRKIGGKILISGGGRCNFTNLGASPQNYVSNNPHFCKSALSRYPSRNFIDLVEKHQIPYHEKKLGQLFCDGSAQAIVDLMLSECREAGAEFSLETQVLEVAKDPGGFQLKTSRGILQCQSLVIATGGLSIPKIGATGFGYDLAKQFGLKLIPRAAALDGFTFSDSDTKLFSELSGVSVDCTIRTNGIAFRENILFTHAGMSGPASLQASLHWYAGDEIEIDLSPDLKLFLHFMEKKRQGNRSLVKNLLSEILPGRLAERLSALYLPEQFLELPLPQVSEKTLQEFCELLHHWKLKPKSTVGYGKAEVTRGGLDTDELSSKTMESKKVPGLYFIGEVVDVTGWLGGYNFQWAWASGWAAGQAV
jgi:predicted Rossmann fold flavoprotein